MGMQKCLKDFALRYSAALREKENFPRRDTLVRGGGLGIALVAHDVELLVGVEEFEALADFEFLFGGVVVQAVDVLFLALDIASQAGVALFHFLDLALFILPGVPAFGERKKGKMHRQINHP